MDIIDSESLQDELRYPLYLRIGEVDGIPVKEMSYVSADGTRYFWLIQNDDEWCVLGDAFIPIGITH